MKIYIYPKDGSNPSNKVEITDYISNQMDQQTRSDDAFAITTFKIMIPATLFSLAKYNIAPFTLCEIYNEESETSSFYFAVSKCNKYLRPQRGTAIYYIHDVTLLEPLALLEAIQVGTKTFKNHLDKDYLKILQELIEINSGIKVRFQNFGNNTEMHNYGWDKGTTAFEIANDIYTMNNYKMKGSILLGTPNVYDLTLFVTKTDLSNIPTITINEDYLTLAEYNQNQDDYCLSLESQVDNVVDRNTLTIYDDLTVRSDDNTITKDNCYIELPDKVESISKFWVYTDVSDVVNIYMTSAMAQAIISRAGGSDTDLAYVQLSLGLATTQEGDWLSPLMNELESINPNFNRSNYTYTYSNAVGGFVGLKAGITHTTDWFDISNSIKDEVIYQALTPQEQTKYCYYKSGDNKVEGIYKYYKDSWVNNLIGASGYPMLYHCIDDLSKVVSSSIIIGNNEYARVDYQVENNTTDPTQVKFRVEAHPITNQYVKDIKTNPYNDLSNFVTARSYGNSANYIDYDIMRKNVTISNSALGTPELTLQFLNVCDLTKNSKFTYDGNTWYVKSIIMNIFRSHIIYTVNSATNYNKQADCIGVRTQYQATKIDLENIKERALYFRNETQLTLSNSKKYYMMATFIYADTTRKTYILPIAKYYNSVTGLTLVHNLIDNYSAGKYCDYNAQNNQVVVDSNRYIQKDARYCDSNGEVEKLNLSVISYSHALSLDASRVLPNKIDNNYSIEVTICEEQKIYKDENESLSFTIYMPNASA